MLQLLPICRKEKYFTSCILPQIICGDEFQRINTFFRLLGVPEYLIQPKYDLSNILFYTEYSLKESADWPELENLKTKETPDLVILLNNQMKLDYFLIVIEAKMYNPTTAIQFREQLDLQKPIINFIANRVKLKKNNHLHVGLLKKISKELKLSANERVISWADILNAYKSLKENYFYQILEHAESNVKASKRIKYIRNNSVERPKNYIEKLTFDEIIELCKKEGERIIIGITGGIRKLRILPQAQLAVRKFKWDYSSNSIGIKKSYNWIEGDKFLKIILEKL